MKHDYDLLIIGAGTAGVVAAVYGKALYKKVLVVENEIPGGRNFFSFTYPLNALISIARKISSVKSLDGLGLSCDNVVMDISLLKKKIDETIKVIAEGVSPEVFTKMEIDYVKGNCSFAGPNSVSLNGKVVTAAKIVLCCGLVNSIPEIDGLTAENCLFAEDLVNLKNFPASAVIIGAGESGIEIANVLSSFGTQVTLLERNSELLPDEDSGIRDMIERNMNDRKISIHKSSEISAVIQSENFIEVKYMTEGIERAVTAEKIICCTGRKLSFADLNISAAGIEYDANKIITDEFLRTSAKNIFAAGDVTGKLNYNNTAEIEGLTAVINCSQLFKKTVNYGIIPRCLNCDMEFARFGMTEAEAEKKFGKSIRVYKFPLKYSIKASIENMNEGIAKIVCKSNSRIIGAQIYSDGASELVHQLLLLVKMKKKFSEISHVSHIFPSYSDILRQPSKRCLMEQQLDNVLLNIFHGLLGKKV